MNTVMDVYIINNIISTNILCCTRGQHIMCNSYITGARDVWHLLHRSTRAQSAQGLRAINAMHPECA